MPEFTFAGPSARAYTESRCTDGEPVGTVEPGDIRDLPEPLDEHWQPVSGDDSTADGKTRRRTPSPRGTAAATTPAEPAEPADDAPSGVKES
jgi:hypothetical protein